MKYKILIAVIICLSMVVGCAFTSNSEDTPSVIIKSEPVIQYVPYVVEKIIEVDTCFFVEKIEEFTDDALYNYSLEQLKEILDNQYNIQNKSAELAAAARQIGWPEDSPAIRSAQAEWWNAQKQIEYYTPRYEELYLVSEQKKWDERAVEYPVATEIWLYMKNLGWNDYVCAGIIGNMMSETGGHTLNIKPIHYNKTFYYYGICQWNKTYYGEIHDADLPTQCDYLRDTIEYEINTFGKNYKKDFTYQDFLNLTNEKDAALAFAACYERCHEKHFEARRVNATTAYNYFVN